jgi:hypothetical protein
MRKLLAICLCSMFVIGDAAICSLQTAQARTSRDERAEAVLRQAREALGGSAVIDAVQNLLINGRANHKIKTPDGQERSFDGNVEMALETSGKLHRNFKISDEANMAAESGKKVFVRNIEVFAHGKLDGAAPEKTNQRIALSHGDELSRLLFGLLLKTSPGLNAIYNYAGEGSVDGAAADIVEASGDNGFAVKLYVDKNTHLPLMMSYRANKPVRFVIKREGAAAGAVEKDVMVFRHTLPEGEKISGDGGNRIVIRKKDENGNVTEIVKAGEEMPRIQLEEAEFQVRFSDYRSVNGLMLPHRIAQTVNGEAGETMTIESYQVNAQNLSEKFKETGREHFTFVRKPAQK